MVTSFLQQSKAINIYAIAVNEPSYWHPEHQGCHEDYREQRSYNLAGQRVNENYKGIVIKNGKKFIQK